MFFSPFSIAITSLGEERANLSAFRTFVRFVLVWNCRLPLPLRVWERLRFVIVALPGLLLPFFETICMKFKKLFCSKINQIYYQLVTSLISPENGKDYVSLICPDTTDFNEVWEVRRRLTPDFRPWVTILTSLSCGRMFELTNGGYSHVSWLCRLHYHMHLPRPHLSAWYIYIISLERPAYFLNIIFIKKHNTQ